MASIYQRNDGRWVAQYVTATGKAKYIYATKRKDVKAKLEKVLEAQAVGLLEDTEKLTGSSPRFSVISSKLNPHSTAP